MKAKRKSRGRRAGCSGCASPAACSDDARARAVAQHVAASGRAAWSPVVLVGFLRLVRLDRGRVTRRWSRAPCR